MSGSAGQIFGVDDVGVFIHYVIFDMYILADHCGGQDNTVFHHSALFDGAATPMMEFSMVPSIRQPLDTMECFTSASSKYCVGAGVVGSGINGPFVIKEILRGFEIDKREIRVIITLKGR